MTSPASTPPSSRAPVDRSIDVVGAPTVRLRAASPTGEAALFVKLYDVDPAGAETLSAGLVAPVRLTGLPADIAAAQPVTVTLPAIVRQIEAGNRLRVVVATSDQAFLTPVAPAVYTVARRVRGHRCPPWSASRSPTRR